MRFYYTFICFQFHFDAEFIHWIPIKNNCDILYYIPYLRNILLIIHRYTEHHMMAHREPATYRATGVPCTAIQPSEELHTQSLTLKQKDICLYNCIGNMIFTKHITGIQDLIFTHKYFNQPANQTTNLFKL